MINDYTQFKGNNPFAGQAKILFHIPKLLQYITSGYTISAPVNVECNLTSVCNLRCSWCISENFRKNKDYLDIKNFKKFMKQYREAGGMSLTFSGGGEPTQYKHFKEAAEYANTIGLEIGLMTNGLIKEELLEFIGENFKWVRVSLDFVDKDKYKKYKGVDASEIVRKNIMLLAKTETKVGINCNIDNNYDIIDIDKIISFFKESGAEYLQFRPVLPRQFNSETPILNETVWTYLITRYKNSPNINLSLDKYYDVKTWKGFGYKSCEGHNFICALDSNGDLTTCMYHPRDKRFIFGNINKESFRDIWFGKKRKEVMKFLKNDLDINKDCQMCCKCHEINKVLHFINKKDKSLDVNFI